LNIFNTPQIHTTAKGATPSTDVLDVLGTNTQLDEASLKLLEQNGELEGMGFDELLKLSEENPEALEKIVSKAQNKQEAELAKLTSGMSEKVSTAHQSPEQANILQLGKSEHATAAKTNSVISSENQPISTNNKSELNSILNFDKTTAAQKTVDVAKQNVDVTQKISPNQATMNEAKVLNDQLGIHNASKAQAIKEPMIAQASVTNEVETKKNNKLMSLNKFMNNQPKSVQNRAAAQTAYKPMTKSMFNQKLETTIPSVAKIPQENISLQEVMFGSKEQGAEASLEQGMNQSQNIKSAGKVNTSAQTANVFNINDLQGATTTDEVITKIQDYVVQSKVANQQEVKMSFHHQELGKIDLLVEKAQNNALNISIGAKSAEGAKFFTQNQGELLATLTQAGVNVGEFKLDSSQSSNNQSSSENSKNQFGQNSNKEHQSKSGQQDEDSQRREELWNSYQDKEVA
jgi:hypothetical protein